MNIADRNTFPYIKELKINDCYAYQNLSVVVNDDENVAFKHLILTGKNGSGKTTTLNFLYETLEFIFDNTMDMFSYLKEEFSQSLYSKKGILTAKSPNPHFNYFVKKHFSSKSIVPIFKNNINSFLKENKGFFILLNQFPITRDLVFEEIDSNIIENHSTLDFDEISNKNILSQQLKQYLVHDEINEFLNQSGDNKFFFNDLKYTFQILFNDNQLKLKFDNKTSKLYIQTSNNQQIKFNDLSNGFSSFLSIIFDLLIRVNIIRKELYHEDVIHQQLNGKQYHPCGYVLIDEPEIHLHLELQYQVLPILTSLFPNLQFIVATHSPAVISSIKNATVYDLSTQKTVADWIVGSSYSELMMTHFGLENEYSNIADEIIETTQNLVDDEKLSPQEKFERLKTLFDDNQKYLSPSLRLSLEVQVLKLENQLLTTTIND